MSQTLGNVPFPPAGFAFVDPKSGALAPAGTSFLRSLWARTGSAIGRIPDSQLPADVPVVKSGLISLGSVAAFGNGGAAIGGAAPIAMGASGSGTVSFTTPFKSSFTAVVISASGALLSAGAAPTGLTGLTYTYQSLNTAPATYTLYWIATGN